jgi:hypothetical protein
MICLGSWRILSARAFQLIQIHSWIIITRLTKPNGIGMGLKVLKVGRAKYTVDPPRTALLIAGAHLFRVLRCPHELLLGLSLRLLLGLSLRLHLGLVLRLLLISLVMDLQLMRLTFMVPLVLLGDDFKARPLGTILTWLMVVSTIFSLMYF